MEAVEGRVRAETALEHQEDRERHVDEVSEQIRQHVNRNNFGPRIAAALRGEEPKR